MMMRRNRGFKLGRKIIRVFKWVTSKRRNSSKYLRLEGQTKNRSEAISKLCKWGSSIRRGLFNSGKNRGYIRVGQDPIVESKPVHVPKGHLAVYVGDGENEARRVLIPVLFLNHPLFGKLLKEAEDVYGYDHPGRITIPCPISEFEHVQTKIAAGDKCRPRIHRLGYISSVKCL